MSVRIKLAQNAKELDEVFQLRYRVYVEQEGTFKGVASEEARSVFDRFDAFQPVANIIAYCGDDPIGTMRINLDAGVGLPPDELYDFSEYRAEITEEWMERYQKPPVFLSAGMLAIPKTWRNRRDVVRALFKMGGGVARSWDVTHVIVAVSAKTATMYNRVGFKPISKPLWIDSIGDDILPMAGLFEDFYNWAFGRLKENSHFLDAFADRFQRVILSAGEALFKQDEEGHEAYIIDSGAIRISQSKISDQEQTLATFGRGELFGELSLFDQKRRSAQATAITDTELIALSREDFLKELKGQPDRLEDMLGFFSARMRRTDNLIAALQGSAIQRMEHVLEDLRSAAMPDPKRPGYRVAKVGLEAFAHSAGVTDEEANEFLGKQEREHQIEFTGRRIRFPVI